MRSRGLLLGPPRGLDLRPRPATGSDQEDIAGLDSNVLLPFPPLEVCRGEDGAGREKGNPFHPRKVDQNAAGYDPGPKRLDPEPIGAGGCQVIGAEPVVELAPIAG